MIFLAAAQPECAAMGGGGLYSLWSQPADKVRRKIFLSSDSVTVVCGTVKPGSFLGWAVEQNTAVHGEAGVVQLSEK